VDEPGREEVSTPESTTTTPVGAASSETTTPATFSSTETQDVGTSFDGPFGYDLLIATTGRPSRFDLDTGEVTFVEGSRVFPIFVWESWLIVGDGSAVGVARLPIRDLGADPEPFVEEDGGASGYVVTPISKAVETGQMWIAVTTGFDIGEPTETLYLIDIETAAILDQREADSEAWELAGAQRDGLFNAPTGGVYQAVGDTYQRVTDGRVLVSNDERVLVETCDDGLRCTLQWLDSQTWGPLDLVVPADHDALYLPMPGNDWIFSPTFERHSGPTSGQMLNIATGETLQVDLPEQTIAGPFPPTPAVSPDGRWLATRGEDTKQLVFRDLDTGDAVYIELEESIAGPMFFIRDSP